MMISNARTGKVLACLGFAGGVAAAGAVALALGFGPLDPPSGPVEATTPSLADLEAKLDALATGPGEDFTSGPWEVFRAPAQGTLADNFVADEIAPGRVYVKSLVVGNCDATLFDGPGSVNVIGSPVGGDWIARNFQSFRDGGDSFGLQITANPVPVEQIVENGLRIAWDARDSSGFVYVLYRPLPEQP